MLESFPKDYFKEEYFELLEVKFEKNPIEAQIAWADFLFRASAAGHRGQFQAPSNIYNVKKA